MRFPDAGRELKIHPGKELQPASRVGLAIGGILRFSCSIHRETLDLYYVRWLVIVVYIHIDLDALVGLPQCLRPDRS